MAQIRLTSLKAPEFPAAAAEILEIYARQRRSYVLHTIARAFGITISAARQMVDQEDYLYRTSKRKQDQFLDRSRYLHRRGVIP